MASFAARYGYYLARGAIRKWGPWAARKYGARAAGAVAAGAAGVAAGTWRKRKGGPQAQRPSKKTKPDIGGRPSNDDTRVNLNTTFNSVSLYNKRRKRGRYNAKRPKTFAGKVKRVIDKQPPTCFYTSLYTNAYTVVTPPQVGYSSQELLGETYSPALMLAAGQLHDPIATPKDISGIYIKLRNSGHIESSAIVSDSNRNVDFVKFWFSAKMDFDIQVFNNEFTATNPLYIDIYECTAQQNITDADYQTPALAWTRSCSNQNAAFTALTPTTPENKGATPRHTSLFSKYWSIDKVTRIMVTSAAPFHYDMYASGIYNSNPAADCYAMRGLTKGVMFVMAPIMVSTTPVNWNFQLTAINKKFKFKCMPTAGHQPSFDKTATQNAVTV